MLSMEMIPVVPLDVVFEIVSFLPWWNRAQPISKMWIDRIFRKAIRLNKWKSKRLMFTYLKMWGERQNRWTTWEEFAVEQCGLTRRVRNGAFRLTWEAAVERYVNVNRCQACGRKTGSSVSGTFLCMCCRKSRGKINACMVTTGEALVLGASKSMLKSMPFYRGSMGAKLRFRRDVIDKISE